MAASGTRNSTRAAIVYNPTKVDVDHLKRAVAEAERSAGWAPSIWLETTADDPGQGMTREALEQKADVVLAAGGDGTVRAVAEALRGADASLALLPAGTGNLLARNLDLTLDHLETSVATAFTGEDRRIDLGIAEAERADGSRDEHAFLVMAGMGVDAQMAANTDPELKKKVGWLAYIDPIAKAMRDKNSLNIRYELDDQGPRSMKAHTVLVGNCGSLPGNILLLPEASVDDGLFDIVALRPEGLFGWLQIWVKIVWENGVLRRSQVGRKIISMTKQVRTLRYLQGRQLTVRLERPEEFELDGDPFGEAIAFRVTVDPLALTVRLPAGHRLSTDRADRVDADRQPDSAVAA